jgi:hypothetical protein
MLLPAAQYLARAKVAEANAASTKDPDLKARFLRIADEWRALAERTSRPHGGQRKSD